jgi:uncharacterized protein (DUF983 family)
VSEGEKSVRTGILRGVSRRCPNCGEGRLFDGYLKVHPRCDTCRNDNVAYPSDDFPAYLTIFVAGHVIIALYLYSDQLFELSALTQTIIWLLATLVLCGALLPFMKGAVIGMCWATNIVRRDAPT